MIARIRLGSNPRHFLLYCTSCPRLPSDKSKRVDGQGDEFDRGSQS
jgi:hypothetical protein